MNKHEESLGFPILLPPPLPCRNLIKDLQQTIVCYSDLECWLLGRVQTIVFDWDVSCIGAGDDIGGGLFIQIQGFPRHRLTITPKWYQYKDRCLQYTASQQQKSSMPKTVIIYSITYKCCSWTSFQVSRQNGRL